MGSNHQVTVRCIAIVISENNKTATDNKTDNRTITVNLPLGLNHWT